MWCASIEPPAITGNIRHSSLFQSIFWFWFDECQQFGPQIENAKVWGPNIKKLATTLLLSALVAEKALGGANDSLSQIPLIFTQKLGLPKCYIFRAHWHKISKKLMLLTTGSCSNCEFSTISSSKLSSNPMNVSFLISLKMMFFKYWSLMSNFSAVKPDGGVFDDQLGDLVGPEDVPVQLLHIAIHNRQVLDFPSRPVGAKVWKVWKIWKVWKVKRKSENLRSPTAMLARLVFSQRTAMPWKTME